MSEVTPDAIVNALRSLGVHAGDLLGVHSSLSSLGHVDGGAEAVALALIDSVGPTGSLFLPTFVYGKHPFDPATTPSFTGAITEAFRKMPGVVRSLQPTHPWAGMGPEAQNVLDGHEQATPFGPGSPVWRIWERNAWILLLGVDQRANSMIHVAEEAEQLPYLERTRIAEVVRAGTIMQETVRRPGHSGGFNKVNESLRERGQLCEAQIGPAKVMLMRSQDVVQAAREMLARDAAALLCDGPACERCTEARAMLHEKKPPRV